MSPFSTRCVCLGVLLLAPGPAWAALMGLSDLVSNEPNPPIVADARAIFEFTVGSAADGVPVGLPAELAFTATNNTSAPLSYNIPELYFNVPDNVTSVAFALNPNNKWQILFDNTPTGGMMVNSFGQFDLLLDDAPGNGNANIGPGQTVTFGITLFGSGTVTNEDFVGEFSIVQVEGYTPALTAARFDDGPNLESGYGAAIPEPVSLMLLALGGLLVVRRRR